MNKVAAVIIFLLGMLTVKTWSLLEVKPIEKGEKIEKFEKGIVYQNSNSELWYVEKNGLKCVVFATSFLFNGQTLFQMSCK